MEESIAYESDVAPALALLGSGLDVAFCKWLGAGKGEGCEEEGEGEDEDGGFHDCFALCCFTLLYWYECALPKTATEGEGYRRELSIRDFGNRVR